MEFRKIKDFYQLTLRQCRGPRLERGRQVGVLEEESVLRFLFLVHSSRVIK